MLQLQILIFWAVAPEGKKKTQIDAHWATHNQQHQKGCNQQLTTSLNQNINTICYKISIAEFPTVKY